MSTLQHRRRLRQRRQSKGGAGMRIALFLVLGIAALGALGAVAAVGTVFAVYQNYADEYVPIEDKLRQTQIGLTEIYDRNGERLGALPNPDAQLLDPVTLDRISKWVIEATVSTEDNTFWDNPGINFAGLARAAWENYAGGGIGSGTGGSSITQQLIKNVYICPNIATETSAACLGAAREGKAGVDRKLREITYALELEKDYPKEKILQWYLNQISYADRYIGIQAAAQGYFHKDAADLTLAEASLLAGVPQYPTLYHPRLNCAKPEGDPDGECVIDAQGRTVVVGEAKKRQEDVLDLMVAHNRATAEEGGAALRLRRQQPDQGSGVHRQPGAAAAPADVRGGHPAEAGRGEGLRHECRLGGLQGYDDARRGRDRDRPGYAARLRRGRPQERVRVLQRRGGDD